MANTQADVTRLLVEWSNGDQRALEQLTPLVYTELRRLADRYLRRERPGHTLQSTALVHEAWMKLIDQRSVQWQNRAHFFGVAAQLIRRILQSQGDYALFEATNGREALEMINREHPDLIKEVARRRKTAVDRLAGAREVGGEAVRVVAEQHHGLVLLELDLAARTQPHPQQMRAHLLAELGLREQQVVIVAAQDDERRDHTRLRRQEQRGTRVTDL